MKLVSKILILPAAALLLSTTIHTQLVRAVILDQSENFNDGNFADDTALQAAGYTFSGGGGLDTDQMTMDGTAVGDPHGADGINDGGIYVDGFDNNDSVTYPFLGTIENGASYMFGVNLFKSSASGVDADIELLANGAVVASLLDQGRFFGNDTPEGVPHGAGPMTLFYKANSATAGQALSFRVRQVRGSDSSFDVGLDNWALINRDLVSPIATQSETFTDSVPFGYTWSLDSSNGNGGYWDAGTNNLALQPIGAFPGDGAADGAVFVNGNDGGSPTSLVEYRFDGVIENGKQYDFGAFIYQSASSFGETDVQLVADPGGPNEAVVATSAGIAAASQGTNLVGASYLGDASRVGQELAFRISSKRIGGGGSSDVAIDGWSLEAFNPNVSLANQSETFSAGLVPFGYTFSAAGGGYVSNDPVTPASGAYPGDAAGDGAIFVNGNLEPIPPNPAGPPTTVEHTFLGKIEDGQGYSFSALLFQASTSFAESTVELIADLGGPNESVVDSLFQVVNGNSGGATPDFNSVQLGFTGDASPAGESLSFRFSSERGIGDSSDVGIDGWSLALVNFLDGDFDLDGDVDGRDFLVWQRGGSPTPLSATDLVKWQTNYGTPLTANVSSVPEPASLSILLLGACFGINYRVRRRTT